MIHSILSKTRINTILNKYADDPILSNSTLSLLATQSKPEQEQQSQSSSSSVQVVKSESTSVDLVESKPEQKMNGSSVTQSPTTTTVSNNDGVVHIKPQFDLDICQVDVVVDTTSSSMSATNSNSSSTSTSPLSTATTASVSSSSSSSSSEHHTLHNRDHLNLSDQVEEHLVSIPVDSTPTNASHEIISA